MEFSGGTASETIIGNGGIMTVNSGEADDISIRSGGKLILNGAASDITVQPNGTLTVNAGGNGSDIDLFVIGLITVNAGGAIRDVCQHNGTIELCGGKAEGVTVCGGTFLVESGAFADRIVLDQNGVFLNVCSGGHLGSTVCNGAEITVESGGVASGSIVDGYEIDDPFSGIMTVTGVMTLKSGAIHRGTLSITNLGNVITESGSVIDFTVSQCMPGSTALLSNFSGINGTPDFTMTVTANQAVGVYALASNVSAFSAPVVLQCESYSARNLAVGGATTYHDRVYSLSLANAELTIDVADYTTSATANQLYWNEINDAVSYAVELSGGSHNIEVEIGTQGADLLGLANGDYTWQVRNIEEEDNRQNGEAFSQTAASQEPQVLSAETNTLTDVFFRQC